MDSSGVSTMSPGTTASALNDNKVTLNLGQGSMDVVKLTNENISTGTVQATGNASIYDILKHETVLTKVSIAPSATNGQLLYSTPIDPTSFNTTSGPSRVAWISRLYRFWRGDFKFRFIFTKTILQQTKIVAVFVPKNSPGDPPPNEDQCFYYNHKVAMNPSNETEMQLDVPFVTDKNFHTMGEPTGMLYVLLFQPLVVSSADASNIFFTMFISGEKLKFHELVQLPALPAQSTIPPGDSFVIESFTGTNITPSQTGNRTFLSDSLDTLTTTLRGNADDPPVPLQNGTVIAASPLIPSNVMYNSHTMRTMSGSPNGPCSSTRVVLCTQGASVPGGVIGSCAYLRIYIWSDLSYTISSVSPISVNYQVSPYIGTYSNIFPSTFTLAAGDDAHHRIADLEETVMALSNRVLQLCAERV